MKKNYLLKVMALLMTLLLMCMPMKTFAAEEEEKSETEYSQARSNPDFENFGDFDYILPQTENNFHKYILEIETPTGYGSGSYRLQEHYYDVEASYGYCPSLTVALDTSVRCDFLVDVYGIDQLDTQYDLHVQRDQAYDLYGQRIFRAPNTVWTVAGGTFYVADDEGEGYFKLVDQDHN